MSLVGAVGFVGAVGSVSPVRSVSPMDPVGSVDAVVGLILRVKFVKLERVKNRRFVSVLSRFWTIWVSLESILDDLGQL